jgi:tetratricopeptide (TPR) repeat protein
MIMKTKHSLIAFILAGVWLAVTFCFFGCGPKPRPSESVLDTPEHHVQSGMKLMAMGKYDDAMREFDLAKGLDPKFSPAFVGSGLVLGYKGDFKQGLKDMDKALDLAKNKEQKVDANVGFIRLYLLGKESASKNWLSKARKAYGKAIRLSPESSATHYYMGECFKEGLMFTEASDLFKKVLDINDGFVVEANDAWKLIQKIERAAPGTMIGKKIALVDQISRADISALFIQELKIDEIFAQKKVFDTSFKTPEKKFETERVVKTAPALDIEDHVLRTDIESVIALQIKGIEPYPDHTFKPDQKIARAEYAMMIEDILIKVSRDDKLATKFIGSPSPFPDLRSDLPYYNAVMVSTTRGIMETKDLTTGEFDPMGSVSGADALLIIRRLGAAINP